VGAENQQNRGAVAGGGHSLRSCDRRRCFHVMPVHGGHSLISNESLFHRKSRDEIS
jgi:hypothetical protein